MILKICLLGNRSKPQIEPRTTHFNVNLNIVAIERACGKVKLDSISCWQTWHRLVGFRILLARVGFQITSSGMALLFRIFNPIPQTLDPDSFTASGTLAS
jgi:hypothetical protein